MSFLVTYAGQFKNYKLPDEFHYEKIHHTNQSTRNKKVGDEADDEFEKHLQQKKTQSAISQYQKIERDHTNITFKDAHSIMTHSVKTMHEDNTIKEAMQLMQERHIHHLPIVNDKKEIVGILSDRDLLKQTNRDLHLIDIMQREIIVCHPTTKIPILASVMLHEGIHCMPIIDDARALVGIVTQTDILTAILQMNLLKAWG